MLRALPPGKQPAYRLFFAEFRSASFIKEKPKSDLMNHEKVLIVEDEENERSGLAEIVTSWGFRVETAQDGAEGLEKATNWSPSIVITDLKMPRMGGLELLGR